MAVKGRVARGRKRRPGALQRWAAEFGRQLREEQRQEFSGLLLLAVAGLMAFSLFSERAGIVGDLLRQALRALMGRSAFLAPLLPAVWGFAGLWKRRTTLGLPRDAGLLLAVVTAAGFLHVGKPAEAAFRLALMGEGGGLIGAAVNAVLIGAFGAECRMLVLYTAAAVSALLLADVSVTALVRGAAAGFRRFFAGSAPVVPAPLASAGNERKRPAAPEGDEVRAESGVDGGVADGAAAFFDSPEPDGPVPDMPSAHETDTATDGFGPTGTADAKQEPPGVPEGPEQWAPESEAGRGVFTQGSLDTSALYMLPPVTLLSCGGARGDGGARDVERKRKILEETLRSFGVEIRIVDAQRGPAVTRFEVQPGPGVKVARIASLADDIALSLAAPGVRIVAPIPGKAALGVEVPNSEVATVFLRDVLESREFQQSPSRLTVALGMDIGGRPVVSSLEKMVHLLIAGATGSGKSVCVNGLLCSLLFKATPAELRLMLIDPKVVELSGFNGIPHLLTPVVTDPRKAAGCLKWVLKEMERRYEAFANAGVRDITRYNQAALARREQAMPFIVVVIDELADLMMVAPAEVEDAIQRLAQMARAAGIHLVVATQRPSVDVITGVIKANIPSRIAFAVSSQVDSRTILDMAGAEKLLGKGDMLFYPMGAAKPLRVQGAYIPEGEIERLLEHVRRQGQPQFDEEAMAAEAAGDGPRDDWEDDLFPEAVRVVMETGQASVSIVQRRLRVGYTRAGRLIDMMEERGIIGPHQGPKPREVLISPEAYRRLFEAGRDSA